MAIRRIKNPTRALKMRNSGDSWFTVDYNSGKAILTMRDIGDDKRTYSHDYTYWMHPDNFEVYVDDVLMDDHLYTYYPLSMDLIFDTALTATSPVVKIKGHLIIPRETMWDIANAWLLKIGMLPNVRSNEWGELKSRFRDVVNRAFGAKVIRRH